MNTNTLTVEEKSEMKKTIASIFSTLQGAIDKQIDDELIAPSPFEQIGANLSVLMRMYSQNAQGNFEQKPSKQGIHLVKN